MFRHQGPGRTGRQNGILAAYLALVAGYVNSAGFVLIGSFTSHVTGNVGRVAHDLVSHQRAAALAALSMIAAFFTGAFIASLIIESRLSNRTAIVYGIALSYEAVLLGLFLVLASLGVRPHPRFYDLQAAVLCMAMGAQNSLVTRLSGSVVRTTHLTGVVTDLAIEGARWLRFVRSQPSRGAASELASYPGAAERPQPGRVRLLTTITLAFMLGALLGAELGAVLRSVAFWLPCAAISCSAAYAFATGRRQDSLPPPSMSAHR